MKTLLKFSIIFIMLILLMDSLVNAQEAKNATEEQIISTAQNYAATYFGGSAKESSWAIALDDGGNVYVAGYTASPNFPTTADSYNSTPKGKGDVFVLKFDKDLKTILASTIIGGSEDDVAYSILYDRKGYIYIAGYTGSKDFPVTPSAYCTKYNGGEGDAFILKMDSDLKSLTASTFLGGSGNEDDWYSAEIVMDKNGDIYIAGNTSSIDFPTTNGAYREEYNGGGKDVFISKFDTGLENLFASTLFGGTANDQIGRSLCIDTKSNEICIAGITFSQNFPTAQNAYCNHISGNLDGFISKFTPDLAKLTQSTILPTGWIYCMFIHENGDIYVGGHTSIGFPTTPNALYQTFDKHPDQGFISRFSNDLTRLKSSTVLPGSGTPGQGGEINSLNLAQSPEGNIISAGWAGPKDFPSTPNAFDETQNGGEDTYVLKINKDLSKIMASTFIGGSNNERWNRMAKDSKGNFYIASYTLSQDFPTTPGSAFEKYNGGETDGFVLKIDHALSADIYEEFHDAAKKDNLKAVKKLLSNRSELLEKSDQYNRTALHSAARYGAVSVSKYLIDRGADLNAKDENGNTPLHLASIHCHDEVVELIVNENIDLNSFNNDGVSPLYLAVIYGNSKTVGLLLSKKADGNIKDKEGNTLLHLAALRGHAEKVREILKFYPEIDNRNDANNTPLLLAVKRPDNAKVIESLLDHGAGLAMRDSTGRSILHITSKSNMELLIKRGADINAQDKDGNTPLHLILKDLLMLKYFHPSLKDKIIMLMKGDADPNLKNKEGMSPMDLAIESGIKEVIDLLKSEK